jgi:hypothetical protein
LGVVLAEDLAVFLREVIGVLDLQAVAPTDVLAYRAAAITLENHPDLVALENHDHSRWFPRMAKRDAVLRTLSSHCVLAFSSP